jgi:hypothetical protein
MYNSDNQTNPNHDLFNFDKLDQTHLVLIYFAIYLL